MPAIRWRIGLALLRRLPQGVLSRLAGRLADLRLPRMLHRPVLGTAARLLGMNLEEAQGLLSEYRSLSELFVRRLRPGLRVVDEDPQAVVSPVDGIVGEAGLVERDRLYQVKGSDYSLAQLLGDEARATRYEGGMYITVYLSPRHYHRIHSPLDAAVSEALHLPGGLLPVNPPSLAIFPELFCRNERLIAHLESAAGALSLVAVGAFNVGRISAAFDPSWNGPRGGVTNRPGAVREERRYDPAIPVAKAEELMAFHLGSTVILCGEPGRLALIPDLEPGRELKLGMAIARVS